MLHMIYWDKTNQNEMSKQKLAGIIVLCTIAIIAAIVLVTVKPWDVPPPPATGEPKDLPAGSIAWDEAKYHIGERVTVCGVVVDATWASGSNGKPTFLNLGRPYPDPDRFTVVIWIQNRGNFPQPPEDHYLGCTICVTGLITEYNGIAEIEVSYPSEIQDP